MTKTTIYILLLILSVGCIRVPESEQSYLAEIYYEELNTRISGLDESNKTNNWLNIIDFGDQTDFEAGSILYSENIEFRFLVDTSGHVLNNGRIIKERYTDQWPFVIYSSSNDTIAYYIAKLIQALGYTKIYFYEGGIKDWQEVNKDFLIIKYNAFKQWHTEQFPFEDTLMALVDPHPAKWFNGTEVLEGHIPGAMNMPVEELADTSGGFLDLINGGTLLTSQIPERNAKIVLYNSAGEEERVALFFQAAKELGYKNLFLFKNGYQEWLDGGNLLQ